MPRARLVEVDLGSVKSSKELHLLLQEALEFPEWYGGNWDAFWDAITGLVEMPETLRLTAGSSSPTAFPGMPGFCRRH